jgi:hypothetical protein
MADIATLGIKIDSSQTVAATTALDKFAAAAKPAAANATALEKAATAAATGAGSLAKAAAASVTGTNAIAKSGSLARYELINLGRQAQDVGVSLMGGQSPLTVLAQQGSQIFDVFSSSKTGTLNGFFKQLGGGIASVLSPARLLVGGIAAIGIGTVIAVQSIAASARAFDDLARSVGTATGQLHGLESAAAFKGINADEFAKGMSRFGQSVYDAKNNMGSLAEVFRANNTSAASFNDYLLKAADLIKNAKDDQTRLQLLQQMGLPATMQWVRYLSQGADGIRAAIAEAGNFDEAVNAKLLAAARRFDEAWAKTWTNFSNGSKSAFISAIEGLSGFDAKVNALLMKMGVGVGKNILTSAMNGSSVEGTKLTQHSSVDDFYKGTGAGLGSAAAAKTTVDPAVLQRQLALQQQYLGLLGQTASAADAVRQVELSVQQARLSGVSIDQAKVNVLKRLASEQSLGITQIKASTDAANIDAATVGMATGQANAYAAATNAINEAKRNGRPLTADNIAQINREASALGAAAQNAENMRFAYENLVRGPMQTFQQSLAQGSTFFDALKKSGISALNAVSSKLMDMAAQNLWSSAFGGSGGGGSFFSSLFGGKSSGATPLPGSADFIGPTLNHTGYGPGDPAGPTRYVHPAHFNDAPRFHSGIGPGERAAIIRTDESVLTPGQMKALGNGGAGGGISAPVTINIDATGADPAGIARLQSQLAQLKAELPSRVVAAVTTARKQRQL